MGTSADILKPRIATLLERYQSVRARTVALTSALSAEDQCVQSMPDASPTKWHLAHTTWFFETLVLVEAMAAYAVFNKRFNHLFNSYYEAIGERHPRPHRGLLTRPSLSEIHAYRAHVDCAMEQFLLAQSDALPTGIEATITLGLQHEQQHQELLVTDIVHAFSCNPLLPAMGTDVSLLLHPQSSTGPVGLAPEHRWLTSPGGLVEIGSPANDAGHFVFDNEQPRHAVYLQPFQIADRLVTCEEFANFIDDGGYQKPELWLSDGWQLVKSQQWRAPLYWYGPQDLPAQWSDVDAHGGWRVFGVKGLQPLSPHLPVMQVSFYEAAAYAEWAGARLPTESEWEAAAAASLGMRQLEGHVWQWTRSSYDPYPGFRPTEGLAAEYNGKFMVGQMVLRGGSMATPPQHSRLTYRNFFPPATRWQFSGIRLAKDIE